MRQTLFHIPHSDPHFGIQVFGWGWVLWVWVVVCLVTLLMVARRREPVQRLLTYLPSMVIPALIIVWVLPELEERVVLTVGAAPTSLGIAIRGYGVMLLAAVIAGIALCVRRATQVGIDVDLVYALAMWMFIPGIIGARLFFVIQKWDEFEGGDLSNVVTGILNITQGGLVVYGSFVGAVVGVFLFLHWHPISFLKLGDLIAPGMLIGLAIGRIGCLMNGCCYGGLSDYPWALTFPPQSAPYMEQRQIGLLHGIRIGQTEQGEVVVERVAVDSAADQAGIQAGDTIQAIDAEPIHTASTTGQDAFSRAQQLLFSTGSVVTLELSDGRHVTWDVKSLPVRSLPVNPTQLYSAMNAALLCLLLWYYYPFRRREGHVFALMLTLYPITRFLLEQIRVDEAGVFGTVLTISQIASLGLLVVAVGLWIYLVRQPKLAGNDGAYPR